MEVKFEVKPGAHKVSKREWKPQTEAFDNGESMGIHVYDKSFKRKAEASLFAKVLAAEEQRRVMQKTTAALQIVEALLKRV